MTPEEMRGHARNCTAQVGDKNLDMAARAAQSTNAYLWYIGAEIVEALDRVEGAIYSLEDAMSEEYVRDHGHDFIVSLAKVQNRLEMMLSYLGAEVLPAIEDMDIIAESDTEEMRGRLEDLDRVLGTWKATPFSWEAEE